MFLTSLGLISPDPDVFSSLIQRCWFNVKHNDTCESPPPPLSGVLSPNSSAERVSCSPPTLFIQANHNIILHVLYKKKDPSLTKYRLKYGSVKVIDVKR